MSSFEHLLGMRKTIVAIVWCVFAWSAAAAPPRFLNQNWSEADRRFFYITPQGSKLVPYTWALALERDDGKLWSEDLERYGFLTNPYSAGLPVGLVRDDVHLGLTCAACHTGSVEFGGTTYLIDGGPSDADIWTFLADLGDAVSATAKSAASPRFDRFAKRVLGGNDSPNARAALFKQLRAYNTYYKNFIAASKPATAWGRARIDAFGMIFNRVTSIDLDMPQNSCRPNAPVSLPMVWDSSWQSVVQWNGSAPSTNVIDRLARNVGEVLGVFAEVKVNPATSITYPSTAKRFNLIDLEDKIAALRSPQWQTEFGAIDANKVGRGQTVYEEQCLGCHPLVTPGQKQTVSVQAVGTDQQMATAAKLRVGKPGPLTNVREMIFLGTRFGAMKAGSNPAGLACNPMSGSNTAPSGKMTLNVVMGAILSLKDLTETDTPPESPVADTVADDDDQEREHLRELLSRSTDTADAELNVLVKAMAARKSEHEQTTTTELKYKARPLDGVWATGPFLHNGSIPTLWDLLLPPPQRPATFYVGGRELDPVKVGFVSTAGPNTTLFDTRIPGNRNIGHEYGTGLSEEDRVALIEYLKTL